MIVRLSLLRKTILIPEYLAFMCVSVFVDGSISRLKVTCMFMALTNSLVVLFIAVLLQIF